MSKKIPYPAIRVSKEWFDYLQKLNYPSAGPYPNITGMRKLYWGDDAPIVICDTYAFKVSDTVYYGLKTIAKNI